MTKGMRYRKNRLESKKKYLRLLESVIELQIAQNYIKDRKLRMHLMTYIRNIIDIMNEEL